VAVTMISLVSMASAAAIGAAVLGAAVWASAPPDTSGIAQAATDSKNRLFIAYSQQIILIFPLISAAWSKRQCNSALDPRRN
jgi:hypothetical protein